MSSTLRPAASNAVHRADMHAGGRLLLHAYIPGYEQCGDCDISSLKTALLPLVRVRPDGSLYVQPCYFLIF
jgi:hypothetical protein